MARLWVATGVGLGVLGGVIWAAWALWPQYTPPLDTPPADLVKFAGSSTFTTLSDDRKAAYVRILMDNRWQLLEALRTGKLDRQDAHRAFENAWQVAAAEHLKAYYARADAQGRQAYLDSLIDDMEKGERMRSMMNLGVTAKKPAPTLDPGKLKDRLEQMPPGMRSQMAGLYADMRKRRVQRGLPAEPSRGR